MFLTDLASIQQYLQRMRSNMNILNMMKPASLSVVASTSYVQGTPATPGLESKSKHLRKKMSEFHDSRGILLSTWR